MSNEYLDEEEIIRAIAKRVPGSAQKARLVANEVRGLEVPEALTLLHFMPQSAAKHIRKVLESAAANAEENHGLGRDELYIKKIAVDEGPTRKWRKFGARGRWKPILRRTAHIIVELASID